MNSTVDLMLSSLNYNAMAMMLCHDICYVDEYAKWSDNERSHSITGKLVIVACIECVLLNEHCLWIWYSTVVCLKPVRSSTDWRARSQTPGHVLRLHAVNTFTCTLTSWVACFLGKDKEVNAITEGDRRSSPVFGFVALLTCSQDHQFTLTILHLHTFERAFPAKKHFLN